MAGLLCHALRRIQQTNQHRLPTLLSTIQQNLIPADQITFLSSEPSILRSEARRWFASSTRDKEIQQLQKDLQMSPHSLQYDERQDVLPPEIRKNPFAGALLTLLMFNTNKNQLIIGGQQLYDAIKEQVDDGSLQKAFGMDPTVFYSTFTLLALHVWMIIYRLCLNNTKDDRFFRQRFYNHYMNDVEDRVYKAGVQVGVSKWLKKLEAVFYSASLSLDQALQQENFEPADSPRRQRYEANERVPPVEEVLLREFFGNDQSKRTSANLIGQYLRLQLKCLELTDESSIMKGHIQFSKKPFESFRAAIQQQQQLELQQQQQEQQQSSSSSPQQG